MCTKFLPFAFLCCFLSLNFLFWRFLSDPADMLCAVSIRSIAHLGCGLSRAQEQRLCASGSNGCGEATAHSSLRLHVGGVTFRAQVMARRCTKAAAAGPGVRQQAATGSIMCAAVGVVVSATVRLIVTRCACGRRWRRKLSRAGDELSAADMSARQGILATR
jgi:hypothetical protein